MPFSYLAVSTGALVGDDELWIGSWYGQVFRWRNNEWAELVDRDTGPTGRIHAMSHHDGLLYVGGRGLWSWEEREQRLAPIEPLGEPSIRALAGSAQGELLLSTSSSLLVERAGEWQELWQLEEKDRELTALFVRGNGTLLLGTHNGFVVLDAHGNSLSRDLEASWITGFAEDAEGRWWVASWQQGLFVEGDGEWRKLGYSEGLDGDSLSALRIDQQERLWLLSTSGKVGVYARDRLLSR